MSFSIGVDIGGTKIAAGLVDDDGEVVDFVREDTPATEAEEIASIVADLVGRLRGDHEVAGVGIGAAGFVDADRSTVLFAPNIEWVNEPLGQHVRDRIDLPVIVENDANAAAWGEFRFGAGEDTDDLLLVTVGTGIGGGVVHHGKLFRGGYGVAAEIGHMRVVPNGIICGCGKRGCWEQYGSGTALVRDAHERCERRFAATGPLLDAAGGNRDDITGSMVTELAQNGDELSIELLAGVGRWLGEGIATLCSVLDPRVVALGGGVAAAGQLLLEPAQAAFDEHLSAHAYRPLAQLRLASMGNRAGLIGAADLARNEPS